MTRRTKHRGERPPGLFTWSGRGEVVEDQAADDNPKSRPCRREDGGCGAPAWEACTRPGRGGRVKITGVHGARKNPSTQPPENQRP